MSGYVVAKQTYAATLAEVPLTAPELKLYKMHIALRSVNGGELFSINLAEE